MRPKTRHTGPGDLPASSDEQLLAAYRDHSDRQAFARLVDRYEAELYSYLRRYLADAELAEDVFQATFLQVHLKVDQFDFSRRFRPWLYRIATNMAIDAQRRNRRHRATSLEGSAYSGDEDSPRLIALLASDREGPVDAVELEEQRQWVREQMDALSEPLRSVVYLVYYQGLKYREVGEALSIPVGTVKSRMHTATNLLAKAWEDQFGAA